MSSEQQPTETPSQKGYRYTAHTLAAAFTLLVGVYIGHLYCQYRERPIIVQPKPDEVKPEPKPPWWKRNP